MSAPRAMPDVAESRPFRFYEIPLLYACEGCGAARFFFARVDNRLLCSECWKAAGSPFPRDWPTEEEAFMRAQEVRARMKAVGGSARHLVNAGKS